VHAVIAVPEKWPFKTQDLTIYPECFIIYKMNSVKANSRLSKIARTLRVFREKKGKMQQHIAQGAGVSVSMLSQIERGRVTPSLDTLFRLCDALELDIYELFRLSSPSKPVKIQRRGERLKTNEGGICIEQLVSSPDSSFPAEMFLLEVIPNRRMGLSGEGHEGVELGYVLEGKAMLTVQDETFLLTAGDSVSFNARLRHELVNNHETTFRAVWTVMPPHHDYFNISETSSR